MFLCYNVGLPQKTQLSRVFYCGSKCGLLFRGMGKLDDTKNFLEADDEKQSLFCVKK